MFKHSLILINIMALAMSIGCSSETPSSTVPAGYVAAGTSRMAIDKLAFDSPPASGEDYCADNQGCGPITIDMCYMTRYGTSLALVEVEAVERIPNKEACDLGYAAGIVRTDMIVWAVVAGEALPEKLTVTTMSEDDAAPYASYRDESRLVLWSIRRLPSDWTLGPHVPLVRDGVQVDEDVVDALGDEDARYIVDLPTTFEELSRSAENHTTDRARTCPGSEATSDERIEAYLHEPRACAPQVAVPRE